jgi:demethylmenaquinone methyltransferase/2-methoxy-6-polyprenyl-1,4-benzoquinol methylase
MQTGQEIYNPAYVKQVFDRCSDKYITFSYLCSMGFTERWRKQCVTALSLHPEARTGYDLRRERARSGRIFLRPIRASKAL